MDIVDTLILRIIDSGEPHVATTAARELGVSRQTIATRLKRMAEDGIIKAEGIGRGRRYELLPILSVRKIHDLEGLDEHRLWMSDIAPLVSDLQANVVDIWRYGITEMVNNAIDHSEGRQVIVSVERTALHTAMQVSDDGEGIFHRIQRLLGLYDPRESILELAKGKLTTDPARHSGEGVFFASRMFDHFSIVSRSLVFSHEAASADWLVDTGSEASGTQVAMTLANDSPRTLKAVFDTFAAPEEYTFAKTIVPVRLAQHEGEKLVSRSQAKRLTMRFERFQTVVLDFTGVEEIGQAFADEVFRVFQASHPALEMTPINMTEGVRNMVARARAA
ncbi:STAS-like domain-containing protein [Thauera sp.]|uniref:STAS-like domain-containing protein n=1 Tax=Thauera sp. TaxID=1905334 RepID=UPI0039E543C4